MYEMVPFIVATSVLSAVWILLLTAYIAHHAFMRYMRNTPCTSCDHEHHTDACPERVSVRHNTCTDCNHKCHKPHCDKIVKRENVTYKQVKKQKPFTIGHKTESQTVTKYKTEYDTYWTDESYNDTEYRWTTYYGSQYSGGSDSRYEPKTVTKTRRVEKRTPREVPYKVTEDVSVPIKEWREVTESVPVSTWYDAKCECWACKCSTCFPGRTEPCGCNECECRQCVYARKTKYLGLAISLTMWIITSPTLFIAGICFDNYIAFAILQVSAFVIPIPASIVLCYLNSGIISACFRCVFRAR